MRRVILSAIILICISLPSIAVRADNSCNPALKISNDKIEPGENVFVGLALNARVDLNVSTFRLKVHFDESMVEFKSIEALNNLESSEFKYYADGGVLTVVYLRSRGGINLKANEIFDVLNMKFKVFDNAQFGNLSFYAEIDGVGDREANEIYCDKIESVSAEIFSSGVSNCRLKSLSVSSGQLEPDFDPYITEYSVSVPFEVKTIEVYAEAQDSSDTIRVNRKTLGSGGSDTNFTVTVTSQNKKNKLVYTIVVHRNLKDGSENNSTDRFSNSSKVKAGNTENSSTPSNPKNSVHKTSNNGFNGAEAEDCEPNSILLKNNSFISFMIGLLVSLVILAIVFVIYRFSISRKNGKHFNID